MSEIRIIIADDHTVVRKGTRQILEQELDFKVVGEAANGEEAVRLVTQLKPEVAIIDIAMPIMDGIESTKQIKRINPATAVLILSAYDNDEFILALLEAGMAGYLLKDASGQDIIKAIRAILRGESVLHPVIARKVMNRFLPGSEGKKDDTNILTDREKVVLQLAAEAPIRIALVMEISFNSRRVHRTPREVLSISIVPVR